MKKRLLCLFMSICMCLSLSLFAHAENIEGPITTEPIVTQPTLEVSSVPQGAVAVGKIIKQSDSYPGNVGDIRYYRVSGAIISNFTNSTMRVPGWSPTQSIASKTSLSRGIIGGIDNRTKITDTEQMPYSPIMYIECTFSTGISRGTAFMISETVALTAGHALYKQDLDEWASKVKVWPGKSGLGFFNNPYGTAEAIEIVISPQWMEGNTILAGDTSSYYDWGLLRFDAEEDQIGSETGYFGFQFIPHSMIGMQVHVTGYPYNDATKYYQWTQEGPIVIPSELSPTDLSDYTYIMHYYMDTQPGQSGGPIYYQSSDGTWTAVGIISAEIKRNDANETPIFNEGIRFTSSLFSFILAYRSY